MRQLSRANNDVLVVYELKSGPLSFCRLPRQAQQKVGKSQSGIAIYTGRAGVEVELPIVVPGIVRRDIAKDQVLHINACLERVASLDPREIVVE